MVATCGDEFHRSTPKKESLRSPIGLNLEQERISRELKVHSLEGVVNHAHRARAIREHIDWILDGSRDVEIKKLAGFQWNYPLNLLAVSEQALPYLVLEHNESHPEFYLLRESIWNLRNKIFSSLRQ